MLERLRKVVDESAVCPAPFDQVYLEGVFAPESYERVLAHLPETRRFSTPSVRRVPDDVPERSR
jgi:hypothetical protein